MLSALLVLSGCATFKFLDGSNEKEIQSFCSGEKVNPLGETTEMTRRRVEIEQRAMEKVQSEASKRQVAEKKYNKDTVRLNNEIDSLQIDINSLEGQISDLERENRKLMAKSIIARVQNISAKVNIPLPKKVKIKVLSGSGTLIPAFAMVKKLEGMGYKVDRSDIAPSTAFPNEKVFYSEGHEAEGKLLAGKISPDAVAAPMSWDSIFDIIVVTSNKSDN